MQRHSSSVLHLCTTLLGNPFEAQDVAQEAALQAFLGLSRLREPARFAAWFHAIAANLARMALRRRRELPLQTLSDEDRTHTFWRDSPPTPEEYQMEREIQESILLALQNLSRVNRQAVIGFYLQGYSYEELAQLLDIPVSTVKLPDQRETAWLLVPPLIWEKITRQLQGLREPRQKEEQAPGATTPIPDVLPPQVQQQAEEHLARLIEMPEVRTAFLLNPLGRVSARQGPDTQEALSYGP